MYLLEIKGTDRFIEVPVVDDEKGFVFMSAGARFVAIAESVVRSITTMSFSQY